MIFSLFISDLATGIFYKLFSALQIIFLLVSTMVLIINYILWQNLGSTILPSISVTRTISDGIHWTPETARCLLDLWFDRLSLN